MNALLRSGVALLLVTFASPAHAQTLKGYVTQAGWQEIPLTTLVEGYSVEQLKAHELALTVRGASVPYAVRDDALVFEATEAMLATRKRVPFFLRARTRRASTSSASSRSESGTNSPAESARPIWHANSSTAVVTPPSGSEGGPPPQAESSASAAPRAFHA